MADALVSTGMRDAGYQYVVIDDCWQVERDAEGNIIPDSQRFPSGMKALADYVHSKGLKFGLYSDAGTLTCQKRPGGRGYEFQDARQYAAWGVDYLKYDWCSTTTQNQQASYSIMRDALLKSGRPIVFSICEWGTSKPWTWARDVGNLWRTTGDIQDCWDCKRDWGGMGFVHILDLQDGLESYAGPGHWNDPDMQVEYVRSEEHTSELQSLAYLVCRLLLEKKKNTTPSLLHLPIRRPFSPHSPALVAAPPPCHSCVLPLPSASAVALAPSPVPAVPCSFEPC